MMLSKVCAKRKAKAKASAKAKRKASAKGKEKGKSKDKSKEGTSDTSNTKCSFCKGNDCPKSLTWPAEEKTMSHELCKLTMIDSDALVHVRPPKNGQGDGFRKSSETRPLLTASGTEVQQRGMRHVSYDTEVGRVTAVSRVLDMRRPIWSLGSMMYSGCDVYFTKDRCWIAKSNGEELGIIPSNKMFFVAAKPSKLLSRKRSALELNSMSPAEVEQVTLTRVHAGLGVSGPAARDTLDGEKPSVRIRIPTGPATPSAVERTLHKASGHALYRRWCRWCGAARAVDEPHLRKQQSETDEAVSRNEFDSVELEREEDRTLSTSSLNAYDDGSESSTAILCSTKAFSEYLTETTVAFVEVLGHNVVMLRSDQELVLEQLLKTVQNRRPIETSVRHGPKTSHQSQSKNEDVNQVINGVCWSVWLSV